MPNWKTHIEVSKQLNKVLKYNDKQFELFAIGSILPDVNNGHLVKNISTILDHHTTHFNKTELKTYECFYNLYKDYFNNPLIFGYFTHLFTDYNFNNNFYSQADRINLEITLFSEREIKQHDFKIFNNLFNENTISLNNINDVLDSIKIIKEISITAEDLKVIKEFLDNQEKYIDEYIFYQENELEALLDETVNKIIDMGLINK